MRFLCPTHMEMYANQPDEVLSQKWVEWMYAAGVQYAEGRWQRALVFSGSAFDLARTRLQRKLPRRHDIVTQVALAGIYAANVYEHLHLADEARHIRWLASESLSVAHSRLDMIAKAECNTCRRYLHDLDRQGRYVQHYLNIPFEKASFENALSEKALSENVLEARPLHVAVH